VSHGAREEAPTGRHRLLVGDIVRYIEFVVSLAARLAPEGTTSSYGQSVSIPENMNTIIHGMPPGHEWL